MKIRVRLTIGEMKPEPRNPTSRYVPTTGIHGAALAYIADNKPFFTYWDVPRMLRDPWIRFLSRVWMSPLRKQTWTVRATSPEVAQTVDRTLRRIWSRAVPTIMREYFAWGFAPGGVEYRVKNDRWVFDSMRRIEPKDARPLVVKDGKNAGDFCGFTLTGLQDQGNCDVFKPYAFWFAGLKKFNNFFDEPPLAGCFDPWSECNTRGGARHLRILWMRKHAIGPAKMYYKPGTTVMVDANGAEVDADNKTLALATLEYLESGGNVAIPSEFDEKGNRLWELETADPKGDIAGVMDYPKELKKEMAEAVGIPFEAIEAAEVGSGWSGRSIPYSTWLGVIDELAGPLVDAIDDAPMRQLVFINHGPRADYEIELISLSKQFEEENKENRPAQVSPGGPPQQPPPQAGPSAPSPGDDGDDPFDVDAFQMSQAGMRVSPEVAGITAENAKKKQNNATRMALLAMLDLQEQAINEGDPGKYQDAMDELAALAHDPEQMRAIAAGEPFDMAWMPYQGPRGGKGYKDDETGRVRYQATKPGERRERAQADAKRATELIQKVRWDENGHEHLQSLVDHLPAMTVDKLRYARQMLGAKFGGATKRAAMIEALKAHAIEAGKSAQEPESVVSDVEKKPQEGKKFLEKSDSIPKPEVSEPNSDEQPRIKAPNTIHGRSPVENGKKQNHADKTSHPIPLGTVIADKYGRRHVVVKSTIDHVSDDWIEDNDDWSTYPEGPGKYNHYSTVEVHPTDEEKAKDAEKKRVADENAIAASEKAKADQAKAAELWTPEIDTHEKTEVLPKELRGLQWQEVPEKRESRGNFGYGTSYHVATLPDGRRVGKRTSSSYDDFRETYHLPQDVIDKYTIPADVLQKEREVYDKNEARMKEIYQQLQTLPHDSKEYDDLYAEYRSFDGRSYPAIERTHSTYNTDRDIKRSKEIETASRAAGYYDPNTHSRKDAATNEFHSAKREYLLTGSPEAMRRAVSAQKAIHEGKLANADRLLSEYRDQFEKMKPELEAGFRGIVGEEGVPHAMKYAENELRDHLYDFPTLGASYYSAGDLIKRLKEEYRGKKSDKFISKYPELAGVIIQKPPSPPAVSKPTSSGPKRQHHSGRGHSFTKLNNGDWGVRIGNGNANAGDTAIVTKKDGSQKHVTIGKIVHQGKDYTLATIRGS